MESSINNVSKQEFDKVSEAVKALQIKYSGLLKDSDELKDGQKNLQNNNVSKQEFDKVSETVKALQTKYTGLSKNFNELKDGQENLQNNISAINNNFDRFNSNIEDIMTKVSKLVDERDMSMVEKVIGKAKETTDMKMLRRPLRRLAVGTIGSIMSIVDVFSESATNLRENFEDIVAEAEYKNQTRRIKMTEQIQT